MSRKTPLIALCTALLASSPLTNTTSAVETIDDTRTAFTYPEARRGDFTDEYHGVTVADPYRWLEDVDSEETRAWIDSENSLTQSYLQNLTERAAIGERLKELWNYERHGLPSKHKGKYYWHKNSGMQSQSVLYRTNSLDTEASVVLDPNTFSDDGTISLGGTEVSPDGSLIAYTLSDGGSDWRKVKVLNMDSMEELPDLLEWVKFSNLSWAKDNSGFFYSRFDAEEEGRALQASNNKHMLYFHQLGTPQADDVLIYQRPEKEDWLFTGEVSEDGRYLLISVNEGCKEENGLFYKDLHKPKSPVVELLSDFDGAYGYLGNQEQFFWFYTNQGADRGRVIAIDINSPQAEYWIELIPESEATLQSVSLVGGHFIANYLQDVSSVVKVFDLFGNFTRTVELPGLGSAGGFSGKVDDPETFFSYTSYTTPGEIYRYDISSGEKELFFKPDVKFNPEDYTTTRVFYPSKDGTEVPLFISHKKGIELDASHRALLYGYGGFNISIEPSFSVSNLVWMEMGGIYCVANIRGGGEYGKAWHEGGMKLQKQNVFDDFIGAGEWLIEKGYTTSSKLGIMGGSNGGLLVGACSMQRPDLFGACVPMVGVMDMLRFPKFTIGWAWTTDYGSPENEDEFGYLHSYSPYHNTVSGKHYPATMVTTADHDDRVVPAHSFKYTAALQHAQGGDNPILIRIDTRAGHGAGKPTAKLIEESMDRWAFFIENLR
ncbi:MAG: prolyl oligopeptidase [Chlamydiales bacterium]|jgi:prolyl oligopeptidase